MDENLMKSLLSEIRELNKNINYACAGRSVVGEQVQYFNKKIKAFEGL